LVTSTGAISGLTSPRHVIDSSSGGGGGGFKSSKLSSPTNRKINTREKEIKALPTQFSNMPPDV
jgi:hypothetical protein